MADALRYRIIAALTEAGPYGLGMAELVDEVFGDDPPLNACPLMRTTMSRINKKAPGTVLREGEHRKARWFIRAVAPSVQAASRPPRFVPGFQPRYGR